MENSLTNDGIYYKSIEEYKISIDKVINEILNSTEDLIFANVVKRAGVNEFVIRKYPQLRNYALEKIFKHKKQHVISCKIEKVVNNLIKNNKNVTFISVLNKCKFSDDYYEEKEFIHEKIKYFIKNNSHRFKI